MTSTSTTSRPVRQVLAATVGGLALAGSRGLAVLSGLALGAGVLLAWRGDEAVSSLAGVEALLGDPLVAASPRLQDLPLLTRATSAVGVLAWWLAWSCGLHAASVVARQVAGGDAFAPRAARALRRATAALLLAALLVPLTHALTVAQVERWSADAAPGRWGQLTLQTSATPVGTALGLLAAAAAAAVLAAAFHEGGRLRRASDGLV